MSSMNSSSISTDFVTALLLVINVSRGVVWDDHNSITLFSSLSKFGEVSLAGRLKHTPQCVKLYWHLYNQKFTWSVWQILLYCILCLRVHHSVCVRVHVMYLISVFRLVYITACFRAEWACPSCRAFSDTGPNCCEKQEILQRQKTLTMALFHLICHRLCKD